MSGFFSPGMRKKGNRVMTMRGLKKRHKNAENGKYLGYSVG